MIKFEQVHNLDVQLFEKLYSESEEILKTSYPWAMFHKHTKEARYGHMLTTFRYFFTNGLGWVVKYNDQPVMLCVGSIVDDLIHWELGITGTVHGSRSWLYSSDYESARNGFWDEVGVKGWIMKWASLNNKQIYNHVMSKKNSGNLLANIEVQDAPLPGFVHITITK